MKISIRELSFIFILLILGWNCERDSSSSEANTTEQPQTVQVPSFNRDSAYVYIVEQVNFGPRVMGSEGHTKCKNWLIKKLKSFGADVIEQDFIANVYTGKSFDATNIIAQYNPKARKRIILAAHWDTRHIADSPISKVRQDEPILGADDGGSGVGVLLEIARNLQATPISLGVDIILFDAEDYGNSEDNGSETEPSYVLGSQHWAKNPHKNGYRANYGILLDMVGAEKARFPKERVSVQFAGDVLNKVWDLAGRMGYGSYFVDVVVDGITDDHLPVNTIAKIPMIDIINLPAQSEAFGRKFADHWHTHNDGIEIINTRTLKAVGQVVTAVVYQEANGNF